LPAQVVAVFAHQCPFDRFFRFRSSCGYPAAHPRERVEYAVVVDDRVVEVDPDLHFRARWIWMSAARVSSSLGSRFTRKTRSMKGRSDLDLSTRSSSAKCTGRPALST